MLAHAPPAGTKARRTHDALLEATERCLARGGYPGATTTAIAAEAGVSAGTFYTYFSDREQILAVLFARRLADLLERVRAALSLEALGEDGLGPVLAKALQAVLKTYRRHAATFRAALLQLPSSPAIRDAYWRAHADTKGVLVAFIADAQDARLVTGRTEPEVLAETLLVVVQGTNNPLLLTEPGAHRTQAVVSEIAGLLAHLLAPRRDRDRVAPST